MANPNDLSTYLSSGYIALSTPFEPTGSKPKAVAYVEADEDKPYWTAVLNHYGSPDLEYNVETLQDSNPDEAKGCGRLYKFAENAAPDTLGRNKFICVDADLHLLIHRDSHTPIARSHPYVVNTTYYSIENILITPHYLQQLLSKFGIAHETPNVMTELESLSQTLPDSFLLWLACHDDPIGQRQYTLTEFKASVKGYPNWQMSATHTGILTQKTTRVSALSDTITNAGCPTQDWWKLYQGHSIVEIFLIGKITPLIERDINTKISNYRTSHTGPEIAAEKDRLWASTKKGYSSLDKAIKGIFYKVEDDPAWAPQPTQDKIRQITAP